MTLSRLIVFWRLPSFQVLYESVKKEQFKVPDGEKALAETFFNPEKQGWLTKEGWDCAVCVLSQGALPKANCVSMCLHDLCLLCCGQHFRSAALSDCLSKQHVFDVRQSWWRLNKPLSCKLRKIWWNLPAYRLELTCLHLMKEIGKCVTSPYCITLVEHDTIEVWHPCW